MATRAVMAARTMRASAQAMPLRAGLNELKPGQALPFAHGPANKGRVATYITLFSVVGFAAPFIIAKWTLNKNNRHNKFFG